GKAIPAEIGSRRGGDPATLVANADLAAKMLGWQPQYTDIQEIIETAWNWMKPKKVGVAA
ncbi:hypothetical protein QQ73_13685, partial [Candidatus Endoriftia persephone str. Guaymas]|nr:hypothetical protein [Candidatus Endoriftia persephone str. Guaymas]